MALRSHGVCSSLLALPLRIGVPRLPRASRPGQIPSLDGGMALLPGDRKGGRAGGSVPRRLLRWMGIGLTHAPKGPQHHGLTARGRAGISRNRVAGHCRGRPVGSHSRGPLWDLGIRQELRGVLPHTFTLLVGTLRDCLRLGASLGWRAEHARYCPDRSVGIRSFGPDHVPCWRSHGTFGHWDGAGCCPRISRLPGVAHPAPCGPDSHTERHCSRAADARIRHPADP